MSDEIKPVGQVSDIELKAQLKAQEEKLRLEKQAEAKRKNQERMQKGKQAFTSVVSKYPHVVRHGKTVEEKLTKFVSEVPVVKDHHAKFTLAMLWVIAWEIYNMITLQGYTFHVIWYLLPLILLFFFDYASRAVHKKDEKSDKGE